METDDDGPDWLNWLVSSKSSTSSLRFRYLPCLMINKELVSTHLSIFNIQIWLEMIKISQLDHTSRLKVRPWHWSIIMVSLRNNGHAKCLIKLLDQGPLKSMVVNSEDVLNLSAGRSYSAGGHILHVSNRWHEFWSTCKFPIPTQNSTKSGPLYFRLPNREACNFWHQNRDRTRHASREGQFLSPNRDRTRQEKGAIYDTKLRNDKRYERD